MAKRDDDDYDDDYVRRPKKRTYPTTLRIAAIAWIVFGCLMLLTALINLAVAVIGLATDGGRTPEATGRVVGGGCAMLFALLLGGAFIFVGVQTIRGTATDTLGNAIGSLVLGLLALGCGGSDLAMVANGVGNRPAVVGVLSAGINLLCGVGLLAAGVLALVARAEYLAWKRGKKRR